MAINIKDLDTENLAREAARKTKLSITQAVKLALTRLVRSASPEQQLRRKNDLLEIGKRCSKRKVLDPRSPEEILGYDKHGLPS